MKKREVLFKGSPLTLVGRAVRAGDAAPDFRVVAKDLKEVRLADFRGSVKVITTFPSIDTPVCDLQVKEFNKRAAGLAEGTAVIGISMDLPFAQARFCEAYDIANVRVLSDYRTSSFGINYGLLMRELNLLARSVLIVDRGDAIRYLQVVPEVTSPPDYDGALRALEGVLRSPSLPGAAASPARCRPCGGGAAPLSAQEAAERAAAELPAWRVEDGKRIVREFSFPSYAEANCFLDLVAVIADEQGHHPSMTLSWRRVEVSLSTHAAGGLTENDFALARVIDGVGA